MPKSVVTEAFDFNVDIWVVSALNTGTGTASDIGLAGHAMLLLEGVKRIEPGMLTELFIGQYDIMAVPYEDQASSINTQGVISKIRAFEGNAYSREYASYKGKSYYISPAKAHEMIDAIHADKEKVESWQKGRGEPLLYQKLGKHHPLIKVFGESQSADNCAGWCLAKLAVAGIGDGTSKPVPAKIVCCIQ